MPEEHSEISPSKGKRVIHCPGSISLSRGIEETTNDAAEEGTAAHFIAEYYLLLDKPNAVQELKYEDPKKAFPQHGQWVDDAMIDYVDEYVEFIREERKGADFFSPETQVDLGWIHPGMKGTSDATIGVEFGPLKVIDLKYGANIFVDVEENEQAMLYALGVLGEDNPRCHDEVELIIYQPRCPDADGNIVRRWKVSVDRLYEFAEEFKAACLKTEEDNPILCAGEWCQFCPAIGRCPEVAIMAANEAMAEFAPEAEVGDIVAAAKPPAPNALKPEDLARVLHFAGIFSKWVDEVKAYATEVMAGGQKVPGLKLVAKKRWRRWKPEAKEELTMLYGDQVLDLMSPNKVESLKGVKAADIEDLWEKGGGDDDNPTNWVAAPLTDRRKEIVPTSAAEDFGEEDDFLNADEDLDFLA